MDLLGGCLCGAVRYRIGTVFDTQYCHCSMCRKSGGGPVTASAHVLAEQFHLVSGSPRKYQASAAGSRCFCAVCGTMLYFEDSAGGYFSVNISTLDDPARLVPAVHMCIESQLPWFEIADDLPRYEGNTLPHPDRRPRRRGRVDPAGVMVPPDATWQTDRLMARPATCADAQVLFEQYARDPAVSKYMTWRPHRDLNETLEFLRRCEQTWKEGSAFPWTLWLKADGELAGIVEARVRGAAVDVGYALTQRRWRQGLMSEALGWVVRWALAQPDIFRVWATCDVENPASVRVLERVGMQREGILRRWLVHPNVSDTPRDCFCYSVVKLAD